MSYWKLLRSEEWFDYHPQARDDGRWLHLVADGPSGANLLGLECLRELEEHVEEAARTDGVAALLLWSAKEPHFIAGADIDEISGATDPEEGTRYVSWVQNLFGRFRSLPFPTFAVIRGTCLGGGLELCLCCNYRIAVDHPSTKIGLPEVNLGIIPGFGGTVRLSRLLGPSRALPLILRGSRLPASVAQRRGVVDILIPPEGWQRTALSAVEKILSDGGRSVRKRRRKLRGGIRSLLLDGNPIGRKLVGNRARDEVLRQTRGNYPAPLAAIRVSTAALSISEKKALQIEATEVGKLSVGSVCKNLIAIFQDSEKARRRSLPEVDDGKWPDNGSIAILGAGVMGAGIASLSVDRGIPVRLRDLNSEALASGLSQIGKHLDQQVRKRRINRHKRDEKIAMISQTTTLTGFKGSAAVIEAIIERLDVKRSVLAEVGPLLSGSAIFATNTSALSVTSLQEGSPIADRVVGLHFFNPVVRMPLVEVIPGEMTSTQTVARALSLAQKLGKYPVVVKDSPGFLVNRLLLPYLDSAARLLLRGITGKRIDRVALDFGLPMGPFRLMDEVGLDIGVEVADTLHAAFGDRALPSPVLRNIVDKGWLGRKSGTGFYEHHGKEPQWNTGIDQLVPAVTTPQLDDSRITEALIDPMIDEAARCLEEEVVADAPTLDLA
ncbi:MAG TPA: fatty oxidation complex subunit alpha, partial [Planctomycetes bacterium]|nr:fatty oxidation complex subunit alpha [Planctomycetota bacterium]